MKSLPDTCNITPLWCMKKLSTFPFHENNADVFPSWFKLSWQSKLTCNLISSSTGNDPNIASLSSSLHTTWSCLSKISSFMWAAEHPVCSSNLFWKSHHIGTSQHIFTEIIVSKYEWAYLRGCHMSHDTMIPWYYWAECWNYWVQ